MSQHFRALNHQVTRIEERLESSNGDGRAHYFKAMSSEERRARIRHLLLRRGVPPDRVDDVHAHLLVMPPAEGHAWLKSCYPYHGEPMHAKHPGHGLGQSSRPVGDVRDDGGRPLESRDDLPQ